MLPSRLWLGRSSPCLNCLSRYSQARTYASVVETPPSNGQENVDAVISEFAARATKGKDTTFAIRTYKPRTPGLRHLRRPIYDHLWKGRPFLALTIPKKGHGLGGRNHYGRVTVRHRGGGHKRRIRTVDFSRLTPGKHVVDRIEHDPGRSAHIALITHSATGRKSYIIAAEGMRAGDPVESYRAGIPQELLESMGGVVDPGMLAARTASRGNCLPIHMVPVGSLVYNVGSRAERGAVFCRSAGTYATIISKNDDTTAKDARFVTVRLQSGEVRKVSRDACATIGIASNALHWHRQLGKAGRKRWLGIRPTVRGVAMNASTIVVYNVWVTDRVDHSEDHPHGGGRGKSKGNVHSVSPWGTLAKSGYKTRHRNNPNRWMVADRPRNQGKRRTKSGT